MPPNSCSVLFKGAWTGPHPHTHPEVACVLRAQCPWNMERNSIPRVNCPTGNCNWLPCFPRAWLSRVWAVAASYSNLELVETQGLVIFLVGHPRPFPCATVVLLFCFFASVFSKGRLKWAVRNPQGETHRCRSISKLKGSPQSRLSECPRPTVSGDRSLKAGTRVSQTTEVHREHLILLLRRQHSTWEEGLQLLTKTVLQKVV